MWLEERLSQLSPSENIFLSERYSMTEKSCYDFNYKLKPDIYDRSVPLHEFLTQFNFIVNGWNDLVIALTSSLWGKARIILNVRGD